MRRLLSTIIIISAFVGILFAQETGIRRIDNMANTASAVQQARKSDSLKTTKQATPRRKVDIMADDVRPYKNDKDSIVYFTGNFAAHHNGAVISCDSAVRYGDSRIGFFGRVIINQDSIYIYGDSAIYDGVSNVAEIYAPIVKVIDGDALLYTYNFSFNTADKIGRYSGGGVIVQDNDIMESQRGYYYADNHEVICVDQVQMHGADYDLKSDSAIYNTETKVARFFDNSKIWNADGDYLSADEGYYDQSQNLYMVTRNGYILTAEQEMWGDSLAYYRGQEHIIAHGNIQMDDFEHKMLAFGDYAEYWSEPGNAILTKNPSAVSYDLSQSDSVFMSADTMMFFTINRYEEQAEKQKAAEQELIPANAMAAPSATPKEANLRNAVLKQPGTPSKSDDSDAVEELMQDSISADSLAIDSLAADTTKYTEKELKALAKKQKQAEKEAINKAKAAERKVKLDSIAAIRQAKVTAMLKQMRAKELERAARDSVRRAEKRAKLAAKGRNIAKLEMEDSLATIEANRLRQDTSSLSAKLANDSIDKLRSSIAAAAKENAQKGINEESSDMADSTQLDSIYRLVKAYRNVKMYRSDAQVICDSLVSNSTDSIIHLYISPVMWNNDNQIAANRVDVFTRNQQIERAEFLEEPIMLAQVDTAHYNQIRGKSMTALFRDNEIYQNDVTGNVQTIFFNTEDEESKVVTEMVYLESGTASFFIEDKQLVGVTYRNDIPFKFYPINQIPATQEQRLKGFKWVAELRPTRENIFNRTIRSTMRDAEVKNQRPEFPIVEKMDRRKEQLMREGVWYDREDELSPEIIEWRNTRVLQ